MRPTPGSPSVPARTTDPGRTDTLVLEPDLARVHGARAFVSDHCRTANVSPDNADTAVLLTSEVVTNAFLHGRSLTTVTVNITHGAVRVDVSDDNTRHPFPVVPDDNALDGRGMAIVEALSTAWGVREEVLGKTVWFALSP